MTRLIAVTISLIIQLTYTISVFCQQNDSLIKETKLLLNIEDLKEDFNLFRTSLEEGHPGLYRYNTKVFIDSIFDVSASSLINPMTEREFLLLLSKTIWHIHDGHTKIMLSQENMDYFEKTNVYFPFKVFSFKDEFFIYKNLSPLSDNELLGAKIISINGHSVRELINYFSQIFTSDGNNNTRKLRFFENINNMTTYYYYLYGYTEAYLVEYVKFPDTNVKRILLNGLSKSDIDQEYGKRYPADTSVKPAEYKLMKQINSAYIRISDFDKKEYKKREMDFENFLKSSFNDIKSNNVGNLIIDLRNNNGGTDEYGKLLFSYLTSKDFIYYESLQLNKLSFNYFEHTTNAVGMKAPDGYAVANQQGTYDVIAHPNCGIQKASQPYFGGKLYILINGGSFSTTSECLSLIHFNTNAVFIGEESGGGYYGDCGGAFPILLLPNSRLRITIPLMKYNLPVSGYIYTDRGIVPDYTVVPDIDEIISGKDIELDFAISLIKKSGSTK